MKLIGMLDSPFVRRSAISLDLLGLPFEHQGLSVFRNFDEFRVINPVVKAPTLICDDGTVLMDSNLIIQYAERLAGRSLLPIDAQPYQMALHITGLALVAMEKSVQIAYETQLRPKDKQFSGWRGRLHGQLETVYRQLENRYSALDASVFSLTQDHISAAVAWRFTHYMLPGEIDADNYPSLKRLSEILETKLVFEKYPPNDPTLANQG